MSLLLSCLLMACLAFICVGLLRGVKQSSQKQFIRIKVEDNKKRNPR